MPEFSSLTPMWGSWTVWTTLIAVVDTVRRAAPINNSNLENDASGYRYYPCNFFALNSRVGVLAVVWAITMWRGEEVFDVMQKASLCELWMTLKAIFVNFLWWFVDDIKGNCELSFWGCRWHCKAIMRFLLYVVDDVKGNCELSFGSCGCNWRRFVRFSMWLPMSQCLSSIWMLCWLHYNINIRFVIKPSCN